MSFYCGDTSQCEYCGQIWGGERTLDVNGLEWCGDCDRAFILQRLGLQVTRKAREKSDGA